MRARMHAHRYVLSFVYNYILSQHNLWEPKASKHISRAMTNQPLYSWKKLTHHSMKACSHSHENSTKASRKHTSQSSSLHRPTAVWRQERSLLSATQRWTTAVWRSAPPLACGAERERRRKRKACQEVLWLFPSAADHLPVLSAHSLRFIFSMSNTTG